MKTPIGTISALYTFTRDANGIQGEAQSKAETVPLEEVTVEQTDDSGERARWRQRVTKPMRLNLDFDVIIIGDTMTGASRAGRLPQTQVTGNRVVS
ncbi:hypothetical protein GCM10009847_05080 [Leucobacter tardus]